MAEAEAVPDPSEVAPTFGLDLGAGQPSAPPAFDARAQLRERFEAQKAEYESMLAKAHALDGGDSMIALLTSKIADVSQSLDALGATAPVVAAVPAPVPAVLPEGAPMLPAPTGAGSAHAALLQIAAPFSRMMASQRAVSPPASRTARPAAPLGSESTTSIRYLKWRTNTLTQRAGTSCVRVGAGARG